VIQSSVVSCRHHWLLSEPRRGVIHGVCKHCRATRDYPAGLESIDGFLDHQDLSASERNLLDFPLQEIQEE
jgi:hypothetical protein